MLLRRSLAFLYDLLLLFPVFFFVTGIAVVMNGGEAIDHGSLQVVPFVATLYLCAFCFYYWFWRHGGQTLGMKAWHLRLVDVAGRMPTRTECLHRYAVGTVLFGACWLATLFTADGLPLHDRLSGTRIVRVPKPSKH